MRPRVTLFVMLGLALTPVIGQAQVANGTFEQGGSGWTSQLPPTWTPNSGASIQFRAIGGNPDGYVALRSPIGNSQGEACVQQTFNCDDPDGCILSIDYRHGGIDSSPLKGRAKIYFDGQLAFVSAPSNFQDWATECFNLVRPGTYELALCLQVDFGNNWWEAAFDTIVPADCLGTVSNGQESWGVLKTRFED